MKQNKEKKNAELKMKQYFSQQNNLSKDKEIPIKEINEAIDNTNTIIGVIGERGAGKTTTIQHGINLYKKRNFWKLKNIWIRNISINLWQIFKDIDTPETDTESTQEEEKVLTKNLNNKISISLWKIIFYKTKLISQKNVDNIFRKTLENDALSGKKKIVFNKMSFIIGVIFLFTMLIISNILFFKHLDLKPGIAASASTTAVVLTLMFTMTQKIDTRIDNLMKNGEYNAFISEILTKKYSRKFLIIHFEDLDRIKSKKIKVEVLKVLSIIYRGTNINLIIEMDQKTLKALEKATGKYDREEILKILPRTIKIKSITKGSIFYYYDKKYEWDLESLNTFASSLFKVFSDANMLSWRFNDITERKLSSLHINAIKNKELYMNLDLYWHQFALSLTPTNQKKTSNKIEKKEKYWQVPIFYKNINDKTKKKIDSINFINDLKFNSKTVELFETTPEYTKFVFENIQDVEKFNYFINSISNQNSIIIPFDEYSKDEVLLESTQFIDLLKSNYLKLLEKINKNEEITDANPEESFTEQVKPQFTLLVIKLINQSRFLDFLELQENNIKELMAPTITTNLLLEPMRILIEKHKISLHQNNFSKYKSEVLKLYYQEIKTEDSYINIIKQITMISMGNGDISDIVSNLMNRTKNQKWEEENESYINNTTKIINYMLDSLLPKKSTKIIEEISSLIAEMPKEHILEIEEKMQEFNVKKILPQKWMDENFIKFLYKNNNKNYKQFFLIWYGRDNIDSINIIFDKINKTQKESVTDKFKENILEINYNQISQYMNKNEKWDFEDQLLNKAWINSATFQPSEYTLEYVEELISIALDAQATDNIEILEAIQSKLLNINKLDMDVEIASNNELKEANEKAILCLDSLEEIKINKYDSQNILITPENIQDYISNMQALKEVNNSNIKKSQIINKHEKKARQNGNFISFFNFLASDTTSKYTKFQNIKIK